MCKKKSVKAGGDIVKSKQDRKVNKLTRTLNKRINKDIFKNRFNVRQLKKTGSKYDIGYHYYLYCFEDRENPERNFEDWLSEHEIIYSMMLHRKMNNFITESDFWEHYRKDGKE